MHKKFIYIVAYMPKEAESGDPIAFMHWVIEAEDEDCAYSVGMCNYDDTIPGTLLNNYVIPVEDVV